MPVVPFIPLIVAAVGAGGTVYASKAADKRAKQAQAAQQTGTSGDRSYREDVLSRMLGEDRYEGFRPNENWDPRQNVQRGGIPQEGAGGQPRSGGQSAEELYNRINTEISLDQWKAWEGKQDSRCPPSHPFRTDKKVSGGDQNECVETPDNCPEGTRAFGKDQCVSVQDPRVREAGGGRQFPGGPNPGERYPGGPGGPGGNMYHYSGEGDVEGGSETGGDYGLSGMYQKLLGNAAQSQAFLAPQIEALQQQKEGQARAIMASMPPGGQRDRALKALEDSHQTSLGQMRSGLLGSSMSGLQSLYGTQLGDATQRYGIDTTADTSRYGIDQSTGLGYAELGERGRQFDVGLGWDKDRFGYEYDLNQDRFGLDKAKYLTGADQWDQSFRRDDAYRDQARSDQNWSQMGGTLSDLFGAYLNNRSNSPKTTQNKVNLIPSTKYSFNKVGG